MKDDTTPITTPITDIQLSQRKTFRIDGDNDRKLSLDISDMNVITRLDEAYPKMKQAALDASVKLGTISESDDTDLVKEVATALKDIDKDMREQIDYIFDAPVSQVCAPKGTMYDPYNGQFRFEHIIEVLANLYTTNLTNEYQKMKDKVGKHTTKYTGSKRKK